MKVHEYQAKELLASYGIPVPKGGVASTPAEARLAAEQVGGRLVVKAQVHAGGRGKAGGIKLVSSPDEAEEAARSLLGTRLVTYQTGPEGAPIERVLVEEAVDNARELYLGMVIDGSAGGVVAIASEAGGVDIEEVASSTPEKILRVPIDPMLGLQGYQGRKIAYSLNLEPGLVRPVVSLVDGLYKAFEALDCSLVEINPLVVTTDGRVLAVDAKVNLDDDALFKHRELADLRDEGQEDPREVEASNAGVSYVKLDGNIGCIVNGAGLAMATMDVVGAAGAMPANFLDVGGGADEAKVAKALSIILSDDSVETVLVNIFGGILRCDVAARGLVMAAEAMPDAARPMVVRMLGTNAEEGRRILSESGLDVRLVDDLIAAAEAIKKSS
ncbi:MAG: ADP-forming succinate--CoA ligase subunit beta [Chloroflexi bacterium]|nr:ADP-forming succinate--CoA ligase subunit beta [Chloroflexota bacterium]